MISILLMISFVIYGNYIKAQYFNGEEMELFENYDCICDYDINNDGFNKLFELIN